MIHRETYEWTQAWWEQAEKDDRPRVLLVGDSIVCGYRDNVQKELEGKMYVDRYATSRFASDPFFRQELAMYLHAFPYDVIHFNHGLHGLDFPLDEYIYYYEEALKEAMKASKRVIVTLSTPITENGNPKEFSAQNTIVLERNEAVKKLAEKYGLPVDNLYTPMEGHPEYRVDDGFHYNELGRQVQGKLVADFITGQLNS